MDAQKKAEAEAAKAAVDAKEAVEAQAAKVATDVTKKAQVGAAKQAVTGKATAEKTEKAVVVRAAATEKAAADKKAVAEKAAVGKKTAVEKVAADKKAVAGKATAARKAAAEKAVAASGVDDLLGDPSSGENAPGLGGEAKGNDQPVKDSGTSGANGGASGAGISAYASQICNAIQSRLYGADSYADKSCVLYTKLAPNGLLLDVTEEGEDPALYQAALTAAKTARIPKSSSQAAYEKVKDTKPDFKL